MEPATSDKLNTEMEKRVQESFTDEKAALSIWAKALRRFSSRSWAGPLVRGATELWREASFSGECCSMLAAITIKARRLWFPVQRKAKRHQPFFLCERGFIYGDGNLRDVEAGACLQSHVRYSIQSDSVSAPHCGASVSVDTWASPLVRLYGETFQINCISLSVKLGSKLICITAPHDHCNSSSGFAAAKCNWNADGPPLSRAVTPSISARIIG